MDRLRKSSEENNSLRMRWPYWVLVPIVLVSVTAVILLLVTFPRLLRSIIPPVGFSHSTSIEPYDLDFKIDLDADKRTGAFPGRRLSEWRVRLPRAFVLAEVGENGKPGDGRNLTFSAHLYAVFDPSTQQFAPASIATKKSPANSFFIIVKNTLPQKKIVTEDACLRVDDWDAFFGVTPSKKPQCDPQANYPPQCLVYAQYKGWDLSMQIPRNYYFGEYKTYCKKVIEFIDKQTVKISEHPNLGH